ncbi:MAG: anti-sigma factor antagonist [Anaerolineales bacterium]|nr:anti-sigma factor antagonist [Anaerolineales bacterium]
MDITIENFDYVKVLAISGDIDGKTAPQVQEQILIHMQPGSKILLDMREVSFMSSAGLRVLLTTYRRAIQEQSNVLLVGLREEIKDTMSATGFLGFFVISDSLEEGLKALV